MKRLFSLLAFTIMTMVASHVSSAQDIIHTYDSAPIKADILHIDDDYLHYKTWDNPDGPLYSISLSKVEKVAFRNGTIRIFPRTSQYSASGMYGQDLGMARRGDYYYSRGRISNQHIYDYIGYSLYGGEYMKARNQYTWGMALTFIGIGGLLITTTAYAATSEMNKFEEIHGMESTGGSVAAVIAGYTVSAGCMAAGIPLWVKGNRGLRRIADDYNLKHHSNQPVESSPNLTLGTTRSGLGLAFNF